MNAHSETFVIVGAGLAGSKAAETLREERRLIAEPEPESIDPPEPDEALSAWASEGGSC